MTFHVARAEDRVWVDSTETPGLREAVLVDSTRGAVHLEIRLRELEAESTLPAHRHPFEESWYVLSGNGTYTVAGLHYDLSTGDYGLAPVSTSHAVDAGPEGLSWLSVWAPKPPRFTGAASSIPAASQPAESLGRPVENDPRHRYVGHFDDSDLAPFGPLSMPGYHGNSIRNISVRMMVDRLLGAQHHTLFVASIAPRSGPGQAAREHYHPFEEIYFFLSGGMRGTLEGEDVKVDEGDLVWVSVDATHGFVNEDDEPARWLEVQSPVPPDSEAFFFPDDWRALSR